MNQSDIDGMLQQSLCDGKLSRAEKSILKAILTNDVNEAVISAARGVKIRTISDNDKGFDPGSDMHRLHAAQIPVRMDTSPNHMHHKFAVFDGKIVVSGSYNWTRSAAEHNEENIVVTNNRQIVQAFGKQFEHLWPQMMPMST